MNARKIILWGIPILLGGPVIAYVVLGWVPQMTPQKAWITYTVGNSGMADDNVRAIAFDDQGRAWIGTERGVSVFDGLVWTTYSSDNSGLVYDSIHAIVFDERGRIWIGTSSGLSILDGETWTTYTTDDSGLAVGYVFAIAFDERGRAWIGTSSGLSVLDGETWTTYTPANLELTGSDIRAIAFDEQGRAWIGTSSGVSILDGETWTTYTPANLELAGSDIRAIAFDERGRAWVGTQLQGISVFDGETWTIYTTDNSGLTDNLIIAIAFDEHDHAWISTRSDVSVFNGKDWTTYTKDNSELADYYVRAITFDEQGRAWMCTRNGVSVLSPDKADLAQTLIRLQDYISIYLSPVVIIILISVWLTALVAPTVLKVAKKQGEVGWGFWPRCILADTVGVVASYLVTLAISWLSFFTLKGADVLVNICVSGVVSGVAGGIAGGIVNGLAWEIALRPHIPGARLRASMGITSFAVCYIVCYIATVIPANLAFLGMAFFFVAFGAPTIVATALYGCVVGCVLGAVVGIIGGIVSGVLQQAILGHSSRTSRWVVANIARLPIALIASGIGAPGSLMLSFTLFAHYDASYAFSWDESLGLTLYGFLIVAVGGVLSGAIAGGVLTWMLRHPAQTPTPEEDTALPPQDVDSPADKAVQPLGEEEVE